MVGWQVLGRHCHQAPCLHFPQPEGTASPVQQTLDAVVERLLLLNRVVEHLAKAGEGAKGRVFKNARFLNTSSRRTLARAGGLIPMTMTLLPVTYGYARVSKSDDEARNLETQLRLLADHCNPGRPDLFRHRHRPHPAARRLAGTAVPSPARRRHPGGGLPGPVEPELRRRGAHPGRPHRAEHWHRGPPENIDTSDGSAAAKFFRRSMLAQGAYQVDSTSERIRLGLDQARAGGKRLGRPPALTPEQVAQCRRMTEEGAGLRHIAPGDAVLASHGEEGSCLCSRQSGNGLEVPYRRYSPQAGHFRWATPVGGPTL